MLKLMTPLNVLGCIAVFHILFAITPSFDVYLSSYFFDREHGFWLNLAPEFLLLRKILLYVIKSGFIVCLLFAVVPFFYRSAASASFRERAKIFEVISLVYLLGPVLLVNGLLKAHWGRARPAHITEFLGTKEFTPPFEISAQCAQNCSFTSGEGAGATALLIAVVLFYATCKPNSRRRWLVFLAILAGIFAMVLRVAMGRHFTSDTVFSFLFVVLITSLILKFKRYRSILERREIRSQTDESQVS